MRRLLVLAALALVPLGAVPSQATFVAASANPAAAFTTAADFNTVAVALADPGTPLQGTVPLAATASSARGIARVRLQVSPAGAGTWTDVCAPTAAPYACTWDTAGADGLVDVRALAEDAAGYQRTAVRTGRRVDNTAPTVALVDPGTAVHGTVTLTVNAADAGVGLAANGVVVEYRTAGTGSWTEICRRSAQGTCAWATGTLPDGDYDLRARAADTLGHAATSAVLAARRVDNTLPTATLTTTPPPIARGTVTFAADPQDAGSGIQKVVFEARPTGTTQWFPLCEKTAAPYACSQSSTVAADGPYEVHLVTYDNAGNATPSAVFALRIDNTAPTGAVVAPTLAGTVTLTTTAADGATGSGLASVRFERRLTSDTGAYAELCTDTTAPYTCDWAVPAADQQWNLQVVMTDNAGNVRTSAVLTRGGGTQPQGADVQGANGGVAGLLDANDSFTFTYSEPVTSASLLAGWNGAATPVAVRIADGGARDTLTVYNSANTTLTGLATVVQLDRDVAAAAARFAGTLVRSGAQVTLTLGALQTGAIVPAPGAGTLGWTPSATALDAVGLPALTTPVTESGAADEDL